MGGYGFNKPGLRSSHRDVHRLLKELTSGRKFLLPFG